MRSAAAAAGLFLCATVTVSVADEKLAKEQDFLPVDIVSAMSAAPLFDPANPNAAKYEIQTLSACEIYNAKLDGAMCRIQRGGNSVGEVNVLYGFMNDDKKFNDTLSVETRTRMISSCSDWQKTKCWVVIKGLAFRAIGVLQTPAFGVTAYDVQFVEAPQS